MKSSWLWLGIVLLTLAFVAGCGGAQQSPVQPADAPPAEEPAMAEPGPAMMDPTLPEFDIEPFYEGELVSMEYPELMMEEEPVPPPRAIDATQPPAMEGEMQDSEYSAAVEAPPQPMAAAPDFEVVYFDFDKSNIKPEFAAAIRSNAEKLRADSSLVVIIEGHCDERGTTEYNLALGQRRADSVRNALISEGVSTDQLDTVSYGEERPVAFGHDEASWSQNRRGVLTIR
jgi:peptidoglycan-associated lipoprotein